MTPLSPCTLPSIGHRLARTMSLLMLVGLGLISGVKYSVTAVRMQMEQRETLVDKRSVVTEFIKASCAAGEEALLRKLDLFEPARSGTRIQLWRADGSVLFTDSMPSPRTAMGSDFELAAPEIRGGLVRGHIEIDVEHDRRMLNSMAITLILTTLLGAAGTGLAIRWLVRREMQPQRDLADLTRAISPRRLDQRLTLECPSEELLPWVEQFNALMDRLQQAYAQLEAFNADVAHELRTPLANLIGQTELALSRERPADALRETLASNLEETQRLSALVNDMLFLSQADRGAMARRGEPVSLAALAADVAEFHEATLDDAGLSLRIEGDARVAVDEPLFKRALSNLIGNATRFAERGSTVVVAIAADTPEQVQVTVDNAGAEIAREHLPRLFDRFFRADVSRCCEGEAQHHGLGLAIVAAIARMHAGRTLAESRAGRTRVGFTLAAG